MATRHYRAIAYQSPGDGPDDGWDVVFPDFPGCVSQGDTAHDALENGREALALHLEGMLADGLELPAPSRVNEHDKEWVLHIVAQKNPAPLHAFVSVEIPGESVRMNITMEKALVERLDAAASREGASRSGYLAQAVREKLQRNRENA